MSRMFGTDGVRGIAGHDLSPSLAFKLGRAGAYVLSQKTSHPKILVGKDTRLSGDMLENALIAGILSAGATAISLGVLPTPAVAYLTRIRNAAAGVVISASHNPAEYNGIKFFSGDGYKLPDAVEDEIQRVIEEDAVPVYTGADIGRAYHDTTAVEDYMAFAAKTISVRLDNMRLAVDCANGAAYKISPSVFEALGASVTAIHTEPNGLNINADCGSTHLESLCDTVRNGNYDLGIAFDGDADRVLLVDECGNPISGDAMMVACAIHLKEKGKLSNNTLVATIMSNLGLSIACKKHGISTVETAVGDRYVLEAMLKGGHCLGGEQSGHIIFSEHATTGDGLVSALQFLSVMQESKKTASALASTVHILPQVLENAVVSPEKKHLYKTDSVICAEISRIEKKLVGCGRVVIRPSGTEPNVRIMLEGDNIAVLKEEALALAGLIETRMQA